MDSGLVTRVTSFFGTFYKTQNAKCEQNINTDFYKVYEKKCYRRYSASNPCNYWIFAVTRCNEFFVVIKKPKAPLRHFVTLKFSIFWFSMILEA